MFFTALEKYGKNLFKRHPKIRKIFKKFYQLFFSLFNFKKIETSYDIKCISPKDGYEYFFGYYDKSPWDKTDRYMLCLRVKNAYRIADSSDEAEVVLFDTKKKNEMIKIGSTNCWNTQQGCMAQWLGPNFNRYIIYNDFRNGKYVSVIYDFKLRKESKVLPLPIYDVSKDGSFALTLDFNRLHVLRPGYGYCNIESDSVDEMCPNEPCIWKIDIKSGEIVPIIKYTDLKKIDMKDSMNNAYHKINHIMISPDSKRFMVIHRWIKDKEKHSRLITMNIDGTSIYNLSDEDFVSHCCWKNNEEILSFLRKNKKDQYYLLKDKTPYYKMFWKNLNTDGHCTYSFDSKYVITDTYPNHKRMASIYLCEEKNKYTKILSVFSPFKYDNNVRCDLHPRWSHKGNKISFDSVHEGKKGLYIVSLKNK